MSIEAAQAALNELESKAIQTREVIRDGIEQARRLNAAVREKQAELRPLETAIAEARAKIAAAIDAENQRIKAEQAAKAKAEAEAKAAEEAKAK